MECCSFTGHRVIESEKASALEKLIDRAVEYAYGKGCRKFLCGGALGFDTMAAKTVISKRMKYSDIRLLMVLPCKNQAEKWSERARSMYEYTVSVADEVIYISESYTPSCMRERNLYLAEHCDMLVAYVGRRNSGAAQTLRFAERLKKSVYNLFGKE